MYQDRVLRVAKAIETWSIPGLGFHMQQWFDTQPLLWPDLGPNECKTTACVAGWTFHVAKGFTIPMNYDDCPDIAEIPDIAANWLGLIRPQAIELFSNFPGENTSPQAAVYCLRGLAKSGQVDWKAARMAEIKHKLWSVQDLCRSLSFVRGPGEPVAY